MDLTEDNTSEKSASFLDLNNEIVNKKLFFVAWMPYIDGNIPFELFLTLIGSIVCASYLTGSLPKNQLEWGVRTFPRK